MCESSSELADQSSDSLFDGSRYVVISFFSIWYSLGDAKEGC